MPRASTAWLALLLLTLAVAAALLRRPAEAPVPGVGQAAPAFSLPRLDNAGSLLSPAQMQGRVWVLNVWASWCAPCKAEHPLLLALAREGGVPLVGLAYKDDPRDAQEWLRHLGDPYLATALDRAGQASAGFGLSGVPASFVIDRQGVVRHRHIGPLTEQVWAQDLLPLIRRLQG